MVPAGRVKGRAAHIGGLRMAGEGQARESFEGVPCIEGITSREGLGGNRDRVEGYRERLALQ